MSENPGWFYLYLPSCMAVLFSSGDLEVSNSAIQIHVFAIYSPPNRQYLLSSSPSPVYPIFTFPHYLPCFPPPVSSSLLPRSRLYLFYLISCLILFVLFSCSPPLLLSYLITSPQASMFFSHPYPLLFFLSLCYFLFPLLVCNTVFFSLIFCTK